MLTQPLILTGQQQKLAADQSEQKLSFGEILNQSINKLNALQQHAEEMQLKFVAGEVQDVHQVTIAMQEARVAMQLAVEVRNKVIQAYKEISSMPL